MRELVDLRVVEAVMAAVGLCGPALGAAAGYVVGRRRGEVRGGTAAGLLIGLGGTLLWLLWRIYNLITDRLGLDSVANLLVNAALFIGLGLIGGAVLGRRLARRERSTDGPT